MVEKILASDFFLPEILSASAAGLAPAAEVGVSASELLNESQNTFRVLDRERKGTRLSETFETFSDFQRLL